MYLQTLIERFNALLGTEAAKGDEDQVVEDVLDGRPAIDVALHDVLGDGVEKHEDEMVVDIAAKEALAHPTLYERHEAAGILVAVGGQLLQYARILLQVGVEERVGVVKLLHLILIYIEYDVYDILVGTYGLGHLALAGLLMPSDAGCNEVFLVVVYLVERTLRNAQPVGYGVHLHSLDTLVGKGFYGHDDNLLAQRLPIV